MKRKFVIISKKKKKQQQRIKIIFTGFLLTQQTSRYNTLLANTNDGTCTSNRSSQRCFLSGGEFTNLFPSQTALHTIWLRQHNNIAKQLKVSHFFFLFFSKNKKKK